MLREPLKDRARGRRPGILSALAVPATALRNRHGPCPICGGKDRFRFDDKDGRGTWFCSKCGAGDGIEIVKRLHSLEFREAARLIEQHVGESPVVGERQQRTDEQKRQDMIDLWRRAKPVTLEDHAGRYLNARTGITEFPPCLRFSLDERYADAGEKPMWHPALVAKVDPCDEAVANGARAALHRTYLSEFASKADVRDHGR